MSAGLPKIPYCVKYVTFSRIISKFNMAGRSKAVDLNSFIQVVIQHRFINTSFVN